MPIWKTALRPDERLNVVLYEDVMAAYARELRRIRKRCDARLRAKAKRGVVE